MSRVELAHRWVYVGMEKRPGGVDASWVVHLICACGAREARHCATWREADAEKEGAGRLIECASCGKDMRGTWPTCQPTCSSRCEEVILLMIAAGVRRLPSLQNIPIRTELGRDIPRALVAGRRGRKR